MPAQPLNRICYVEDDEDIQRIVCEHFGLSIGELKSKRRTQNLVVPRQIAMFLTRKLVQASYPVIGEQFGGRDHSTVIHSVDKVQRQMSRDRTFRDRIESARSELVAQ